MGKLPKFTTRKQLKERLARLYGEAMKDDPKNPEWMNRSRFDDCEESELEALVEAGVLLQGVQLRCDRCGSRLWFPLKHFDEIVTCEGCKYEFHFPASPAWAFQLNSLVKNAVERSGVIALLEALYRIEWGSGGVFVSLPSLDLYERGSKDRFTDIDIVAFSDGQFIIGEVKSDPAGFEISDLEKIKAVAMQLLPNQVVFAAPGAKWPAEVEKEIEQVAKDLKTVGVQVRKLRLKE
ncbi:MAG: hypothetical protein O7D91_16935 [Planctomycetota bacterium]|nr:hypothetical protein [Planctomycetota bacterium]